MPEDLKNNHDEMEPAVQAGSTLVKREYTAPVLSPRVDWAGRSRSPVRRFLLGLERISLFLERPVGWLAREPQNNPLYHTGTIAFFLLVVLALTGGYLTLFYQFGFKVSYEAVRLIEANLIGRVVRALHRYASDALVIVTLLHAWRTFFQDRFRGPRWLAWVSGILLAVSVWVIGVTGYWLIWDERVQLFNQTLIRVLKESTVGVYFLVNFLVGEAAGTGWIFLLFVITVHLGLSALIGLFFWWHVKRLNRPKLWPPRFWMVLVGGLLLVGSLLVPAGMLPPLDPQRWPGLLPIDPFYLAYLPPALNWPVVAFWVGLSLLAVGLALLPWLLGHKVPPPVQISEADCTGCTLCAKDCPYHAISMVPRSDGRKHKYVAHLDPGLCVGCGICIGSCSPQALWLQPPFPANSGWLPVIKKAAAQGEKPLQVIFTCERHMFQGGKSYLTGVDIERLAEGLALNDPGAEVRRMIVPLSCIGMAHPGLATQAFEAGATQVRMVGCPPEDCANREGNLWVQDRLERQRQPKLKLAFSGADIRTAWLEPNRFRSYLRSGKGGGGPATAYRQGFSAASAWRFVPMAIFLALFTAALIISNNVNFQPYPSSQAAVELLMEHRSGIPVQGAVSSLEPQAGLSTPVRLLLLLDGLTLLDKTYPLVGRSSRQAVVVFEQVPVPTGAHHLLLEMFDCPGQIQPQVLTDQNLDLSERQVLHLVYEDSHQGGDPAAGEDLFYENSLGTNVSCRICHSLNPGVRLVGPSLAGVATRAASRVPGMSAQAYLRESILEPDRYVVDGYPKGQMVSDLGEVLSPEQVDDLVAYLLTFK